jgi:hypothetical protein
MPGGGTASASHGPVLTRQGRTLPAQGMRVEPLERRTKSRRRGIGPARHRDRRFRPLIADFLPGPDSCEEV